jgi:adenylate cyclase
MHDKAMDSTATEDVVAATFAFVDLAGFTALTEAHGDADAVAIIRAFRERTLAVLGPDDRLVKTIGDAVMLAFPKPDTAVTALRKLLEQELVHEDAVLLPRAGAHHGEALAVEGDFYGAAVNLAARVAGQARGRQLLVTPPVAIAARDAGAVVTHVGAVELRNVTQQVDIYDVRVTDVADDAVIDPVCQMRVPIAGGSAVALDWAGRRFNFCGLPCLSRFAAQPETYLARLRNAERGH